MAFSFKVNRNGYSLEECPDLEGIETNPFTLIVLPCNAGLEECPDLEGIETSIILLSFSF